MIIERSSFTSDHPDLAGKYFDTIQAAQEAEEMVVLCNTLIDKFSSYGKIEVGDLPAIIRFIHNHFITEE